MNVLTAFCCLERKGEIILTFPLPKIEMLHHFVWLSFKRKWGIFRLTSTKYGKWQNKLSATLPCNEITILERIRQKTDFIAKFAKLINQHL
jgi:hypothetical protein